MTENITVDILIPAYNAEDFIVETVATCLKQTYSCLRVVVVDDCSGDNSIKHLMQEYGNDERLEIYRNDSNLGVGVNYNMALTYIRSQYFILLDHDDLLMPDAVANLMTAIEQRPQLGFVTGAIDYYLQETGEFRRFNRWQGIINNLADCRLNLPMPFSCNATLFRASVLDNIKDKFGEVFISSLCSDYDFWFKLYKTGVKGYIIPDQVAVYRVHAGSASRAQWKLYRDVALDLYGNHMDVYLQFSSYTFNELCRNLLSYIYHTLIKKHEGFSRKAVQNILSFAFKSLMVKKDQLNKQSLDASRFLQE
jgi:glycosyltransferase involved in cell wall biosynthesis